MCTEYIESQAICLTYRKIKSYESEESIMKQFILKQDALLNRFGMTTKQLPEQVTNGRNTANCQRLITEL